MFCLTTEIPGPNRKNPAGKHGVGANNDADTNDVLKMKQVKVTYQPDDEDLYGSAEDFDDSELPLPPLTPNIYYANGQKQPTHRPAMSGTGISGGSGGTHITNGGGNGGGPSDGRHHHHNSAGGGIGGGVGGIGNLDFGNMGATSGGLSIASGFAVALFGGITRGPTFQRGVADTFGGTTKVHSAMDNKELTAPTTAAQHGRLPSLSSWWWWWQQQLDSSYSRWHGHWQQALLILLVPSLITSFCWHLL